MKDDVNDHFSSCRQWFCVYLSSVEIETQLVFVFVWLIDFPSHFRHNVSIEARFFKIWWCLCEGILGSSVSVNSFNSFGIFCPILWLENFNRMRAIHIVVQKLNMGGTLDFPFQCYMGVQNASFLINLLKITLSSFKLKISVPNHYIA